jgi:hypothetical protein
MEQGNHKKSEKKDCGVHNEKLLIGEFLNGALTNVGATLKLKNSSQRHENCAPFFGLGATR